jgi:hypothetical protein
MASSVFGYEFMMQRWDSVLDDFHILHYILLVIAVVTVTLGTVVI